MGKDIGQFEITVLTGLNAGVALEITSGRHSIGGAETDDIQLDGLSETLADFVLERDAIKVKPRVDSITAKPSGALQKDHVTSLPLPARFALTPEIDIFANRIAVPEPKRSTKMPIYALAGLLVAAAVFTSVQIDFKFNPNQATAAAPDMIEATEAPLRAQTQQVAQTTKQCEDCAGEAAEELKQTLASAGILGLVVTSSGGAVRVEGDMSPEERAKWTGIRSSFDGQWSMVPLLTSFTEAQKGVPLSVMSVWLGEPREIKTGAGKTMRIGDDVVGGWTLSAIEEGYIELDQGDTKLRVNY